MNSKIITLILFAVGVVIFSIVLFFIQKNERKFERKVIIFYALTTILLFFIFGLIGAFCDQNSLLVFRLTQFGIFTFGIFHVWFLFTYYQWTKRTSFFPETFFTLIIMFAAALGFHLGLWVWGLEKIFNFNLEFHFKMVGAIFWWFSIPYISFRLYDFILQIPKQKYVAWKFPKTTARKLNLADNNVVFVRLNIFTRSENYPAGKITDYRARMPKDATFGDFFQKFVMQYNEENPYSITNLHENEQNETIGWLFYVRKTKRERWSIIDPFQNAFNQVEEGSFVDARRVLIGKEYQPNESNINIATPSVADDEIIITEK